MKTRFLPSALLSLALFSSIQECSGRPLTLVHFHSAVQINAGNGTVYKATTSDVNGDGTLDIVALTQNSASPTGSYLVVMLGIGFGQFAAPTLTPVVFGPDQFVIVTDVNNDGKADVILVHPNSAEVLLSNGDGTFAAPQSFATGINFPVAASLWDVNHDTIPDLVVIDGRSNQASFLLGDGAGNFGSPQLTFFPDQATTRVFADVDLDGNLDFVTNINLYPGDGTGGFLSGIPLQSNDGQNAGIVSSDSIAVFDVNGDGQPDVITANGNANTVSIFLNEGNRNLVQYGVSQWTGNDPVAVALADVNWDGKPDLIVTNAAQSDLTVLLGQGDGSFLAPGPGFAIGGSPFTKAVLADFYGDGNLDILVADNLFSVVLARGYGDGTFQAASDSNIVVAPGSSTIYGARSVASGDFNGDGIPDFVVGQSSVTPGTGLIVFLGQNDGSLDKGSLYAANDPLSYVAVGDINRDGKMDIVASNWATGSVDVLLGNGEGTFQAPYSAPLPGITNGLVIADFNGDGWPDVAAVGEGSAVYVLLNDGNGSLVRSGTYSISGSGFELVAADVNNDGNPDLCVAMTSTSRVAILLGRGDGTLIAASDYDTTVSSPYGIAAKDVNFDGNADLVVTSSASGRITVATGNGDGTFNSPAIYPASLSTYELDPSPGEVALADVNEDGNLDIIFTNSGYSTVGVLLGNGNGDFFGPREWPVGRGAIGLVIADLNKDSWPDIVTANAHYSGVSVLYNTTGLAALPAITFSPTNLIFGSQRIGVASGRKVITVTNAGATTLAINSITITGTNGADFSETSNCTSISPNGSCTIKVIFTPSATGTRTGAITIVDNAPTTSQRITLTGVGGIVTGRVAPTTVVFGGQVLGTVSAAKSVSLFNDGDAPMTVTSVAITGDFSVLTNQCTNGVSPGSSCQVYVVFAPTQLGALAGTLTFVDNATTSPQTAQLTGIGESNATTTRLTVLPSPSALGQSVTLTAHVAPSFKGTPGGTVTFYDGANGLGTAVLSGGVAQIITSQLLAGSHSLTASYSGDAVFLSSVSSVVTQVVKQGLATVVVGSNPNPSYVNQGVTFAATVSGVAGIPPTGTVIFKQGAVTLGTASLLNGQAVITASFATAGTVSVTANYSGDNNYPSQTSPVLHQVVTKYSTATALSSSLNPSSYGQTITLTATVTSGASVPPAGTVTFKNGATNLASVSLNNGIATLTTSSLAVGSLSLSANYAGDSASNSSTSPILTQIVNKATTSTAVASSLNPSHRGQAVTFSVVVTSATVIPTGKVTVMAGAKQIGTITLVNGRGSVTTSTLPTGQTIVTATYSGTADVSGSTGSVTQIVQP